MTPHTPSRVQSVLTHVKTRASTNVVIPVKMHVLQVVVVIVVETAWVVASTHALALQPIAVTTNRPPQS